MSLASKHYSIIILTERNSWMLPFISDLTAYWEDQGHGVTVEFDACSATEADFCFCLSLGQIVPNAIRKQFKHVLVVHASPLPAGRGWSPMTWQILEGKNRIPVTLLEAAEKVDEGKIYLQYWIDLAGVELSSEWRKRLGVETIEICKYWLKHYPKVVESAKEQSGQPSYYSKRIPRDSQLDPKRTIAEQFDLLRVVDNDRYPAYFKYRGRTYRLRIEPIE